jgi:phage shock protein PspC (stress-responsive transcriptional regulator)
MNKLYRSRYDNKITGLLGGLAKHFNLDSTLLRVIMIFVVIFSSGTVILVYFVASLVVPKEQRHPNDPYYNEWGHRGGRGGQGGPSGPWNMGGPNQDYNTRQQPPYNQGYSNSNPNPNTVQEPTSSLDDMMKDIEKKAMEKELKELRKKLNNYENEKGDK